MKSFLIYIVSMTVFLAVTAPVSFAQSQPTINAVSLTTKPGWPKTNGRFLTSSVKLHDINHDGLPELILDNKYGTSGGAIKVYRLNGQEMFSLPAIETIDAVAAATMLIMMAHRI